MRVPLLVSGAVLVIAAVAWAIAAPRLWNDRLPPGWRWQASFVGAGAYPNSAGQWPDRGTTLRYERAIRIGSDADRPHSVRVEDAYRSFDTRSGANIWEYVPIQEVNPVTGRHTRPEHRGDILVFPRDTAKITYRLRLNYLEGVPMAFVREEAVEGVSTYLFAYRGRGAYTRSYAGTADYPGITVAPGQEIRCANDQLVVHFWVEPVTGEAVKIEESCLSGDYVVDAVSGQRLTAVMRWGGETAGDDVVGRAEAILGQRRRILWRLRYGPGIAAALGRAARAGAWRAQGGSPA